MLKWWVVIGLVLLTSSSVYAVDDCMGLKRLQIDVMFEGWSDFNNREIHKNYHFPQGNWLYITYFNVTNIGECPLGQTFIFFSVETIQDGRSIVYNFSGDGVSVPGLNQTKSYFKSRDNGTIEGGIELKQLGVWTIKEPIVLVLKRKNNSLVKEEDNTIYTDFHIINYPKSSYDRSIYVDSIIEKYFGLSINQWTIIGVVASILAVLLGGKGLVKSIRDLVTLINQHILSEIVKWMTCVDCNNNGKIECDCLKVKKTSFGYNIIKAGGHYVLEVNGVTINNRSHKREVSIELSVEFNHNNKLSPDEQILIKRRIDNLTINFKETKIGKEQLNEFRVDFGECKSIEQKLGGLDKNDFNIDIRVVDVKPLSDCRECSGRGYVYCKNCLSGKFRTTVNKINSTFKNFKGKFEIKWLNFKKRVRGYRDELKKGYSNSTSIKTVVFCITYFLAGMIINALLWSISYYLDKIYWVTTDHLEIYYMALFAVLTVYATLITLSTSLSREVTGELSWQEVLLNPLNLLYLSAFILNPVIVNTLLFFNISRNLANLFFISSYVYFFISTILIFGITLRFILNPKKILQKHIERLILELAPSMDIPSLVDEFYIEKTPTHILLTSKDFPKGESDEVLGAKENVDNALLSKPIVIQKKPFFIEFGPGVLCIRDLTFLKDFSKLQFQILKYNFHSDFLGFPIFGYHFMAEEEEKRLKEQIKKNIGYENVGGKIFSLYEKIKQQTGNEGIAVNLLKEYIRQENSSYTRYILYKNFEPIFNDYNQTKYNDWEEVLGSKITELYEFKELFLYNPLIVSELQKKLADVIVTGFRKSERFNIKLNTGGLYLKEFLDIRYLDRFRTNQDKSWVQEHSVLVKNTIDTIFSLCWFLIDLDLEHDVKKRYFKTQLGELNNCLGHYQNLQGEDFLENYYDIKFKENKSEEEKNLLELVEEKLKLLDEKRGYLALKQLEIFYLVIERIESGSLDKTFIDIAIALFKIPRFQEEYYKYHFEIGQLNLINYDEFIGGAQGIESFNFNKYRLLVSLLKFQKEGKLDIDEFKEDNFSDTQHPFERQIDELTLDYVTKYFDCSQEKLEQFKQEFKKKLEKKKQKFEEDEQRYLVETPINEKHKLKFEQDCKNIWNEFQRDLARFLDIQTTPGGKDIKTIFGQYVLYPKKWFLDSFDKKIGFVRDSGENFGKEQINGKWTTLINRINDKFDATKDREVEVTNFEKDILQLIEPGKEYWLFFRKGGSIYDFYKGLDVSWPRERRITAIIKLNSSRIYCCNPNSEANILFESKSIILKQYSQGFEDINEELVVQINQLTDEKEIAEIMKKNNDYKTQDDVKQMVKIRVAEKFEIERKPKTRLFRLQFREKDKRT